MRLERAKMSADSRTEKPIPGQHGHEVPAELSDPEAELPGTSRCGT